MSALLNQMKSWDISLKTKGLETKLQKYSHKTWMNKTRNHLKTTNLKFNKTQAKVQTMKIKFRFLDNGSPNSKELMKEAQK